jgi:alanine-glyoxylate transaminase / serine-glyoxylate transaminase / serine-pyruvate transaminase
MEAGLANLVEPGDRVLIASNGVFGDRMVDMARRLGAEVHVTRAAAGEPLDPERVLRDASRVRPALLGFVHGETSTGVLNPIVELAAVGAEVGALVSVDAVTTVGMQPFAMASWGIDYAYTGSQKCLSAPPGLAPGSLLGPRDGARGRAPHARRQWYADVLGMQATGARGRRPPLPPHRADPPALGHRRGDPRRARGGGRGARRPRRAPRPSAAPRSSTVGLRAGGVGAAHRLPTVLASRCRRASTTPRCAALRREDGVSVAGGLGPTAGTVWRLGLMGEAARGEPTGASSRCWRPASSAPRARRSTPATAWAWTRPPQPRRTRRRWPPAGRERRSARERAWHGYVELRALLRTHPELLETVAQLLWAPRRTRR